MKRDKALIPLSHDHHKALVISNRIQATLDKSDIAAAEYWNEIRTEVYEELLAHFNAEEQNLLSLLHEHGGHCLAERLLDDHQHMRALLLEKDTASAAAFTTCLKNHVRFEERELFTWLESRCSSEQLYKAMQC